MDELIEFHFFVPGKPAPGGSKTSFTHPHTGKVVTVDACKDNKPWRASVAASAVQAMARRKVGLIVDGPISVQVCFFMPRPKFHYRTGKRAGELKASAPVYHTNKPDGTKLWRAAEDALSGIVWRDDAQVACQEVAKLYATDGGTIGMEITIRRIGE